MRRIMLLLEKWVLTSLPFQLAGLQCSNNDRHQLVLEVHPDNRRLLLRWWM